MKFSLKAIVFTLIAAGISGVVNDVVYDGLEAADKKIQDRKRKDESGTEDAKDED